jgi:hypothetical protein
MTEKNGRHRRTRTPSHEPAPRSADGSTPTADDAATGRTDGPTVGDGSYRAPDRGPRGHFAKGNRIAAGNPQARRQHAHRMQFLDAIAEGTIPALARQLQIKALGGDLDCAKILLDYCLGKPVAAMEISGPGGESLGINFHAVTAVVLDALADDPSKRIEVAAKLMELDDALDADADA